MQRDFFHVQAQSKIDMWSLFLWDEHAIYCKTEMNIKAEIHLDMVSYNRPSQL